MPKILQKIVRLTLSPMATSFYKKDRLRPPTKTILTYFFISIGIGLSAAVFSHAWESESLLEANIPKRAAKQFPKINLTNGMIASEHDDILTIESPKISKYFLVLTPNTAPSESTEAYSAHILIDQSQITLNLPIQQEEIRIDLSELRTDHIDSDLILEWRDHLKRQLTFSAWLIVLPKVTLVAGTAAISGILLSLFLAWPQRWLFNADLSNAELAQLSLSPAHPALLLSWASTSLVNLEMAALLFFTLTAVYTSIAIYANSELSHEKS